MSLQNKRTQVIQSVYIKPAFDESHMTHSQMTRTKNDSITQ